MKTLHLSLMKEPFAVMVSGEKKEEYRSASLWILKRLANNKFDRIHFTNGYGAHLPYFICEFKGWHANKKAFRKQYSTGFEVWVEKGVIVLELGEILEKGNLKTNCKHVYNYYWKHGKCTGSRCILCGNIDSSIKPNL